MDTIKTFFDNIWESLTKSQKTEVFSKGVESAPETVHIAEEYSDALDTLQTQNEEHSMKDNDSSFILSTSSRACMEVITLQVCVTGQTFNSEQQFLNQVAECLQGCGIHLQREVYNHESDEPLLLFCPVVSRAGTDIHHALENISSHRKVVLVVMHHAPNPNLMLYTASQSQTQHSSLVSVVDCRFSQGSGLYSCQMNTTAVTSVASSIEQLVLLSKETCVN